MHMYTIEGFTFVLQAAQQFNGQCGCRLCEYEGVSTQVGTWNGHTKTYPRPVHQPEKRTDDSIRAQANLTAETKKPVSFYKMYISYTIDTPKTHTSLYKLWVLIKILGCWWTGLGILFIPCKLCNISVQQSKFSSSVEWFPLCILVFFFQITKSLDKKLLVLPVFPMPRTWWKNMSQPEHYMSIDQNLFDQWPRLIRDDTVYLKPKGRPSYHSRRSGFAQRCNVGFYLSASDKQEVERLLSVTYCK